MDISRIYKLLFDRFKDIYLKRTGDEGHKGEVNGIGWLFT